MEGAGGGRDKPSDNKEVFEDEDELSVHDGMTVCRDYFQDLEGPDLSDEEEDDADSDLVVENDGEDNE